MIKIYVVVDFPKWKKKIKNLKNYFKIKQRKFNTQINSSKKKKEFTIFLTNNLKMKKLNNKFRKVNKPTDVLSFPLYNDIEAINQLDESMHEDMGDMFICRNIIKKKMFLI